MHLRTVASSCRYVDLLDEDSGSENVDTPNLHHGSGHHYVKYTLSKEKPDCREGVRDSHFLDISMSVPLGSHRVSIDSAVSAHVP